MIGVEPAEDTVTVNVYTETGQFLVAVTLPLAARDGQASAADALDAQAALGFYWLPATPVPPELLVHGHLRTR